MNQVLEEISRIGIVPVIAIEDAADAVPLAQALCKGGLCCAEVTFRTAAAKDAIFAMTQAYPDMMVGAGTVLTTKQVDEAVNAGAKFIVSPGLNKTVVSYCIEKNIPVTPGCSSPSDIEAAIELGLEVVKFFPAQAAGGLAMIKAMSAPYTNVLFMPTGGITAKNLCEYLDFGKIIACGGSWMVGKDMIVAKDWDTITDMTKEAVKTMLGFELAHIGINAENEEQARKAAAMFEKVFGFIQKDGSSSVFAGTEIEVMKTPYLGKYGHIAIRTNYIERAVYHLGNAGVLWNEESAKKDAKGKLKAIYLQEEFAGFAVHLVQK